MSIISRVAYKILIADDNPHITSFVQPTLERAGYVRARLETMALSVDPCGNSRAAGEGLDRKAHGFFGLLRAHP